MSMSTRPIVRFICRELCFDFIAQASKSQLSNSAAFAVSYGLGFASITATIVHTLLYARNSVVCRFKGGVGERPDIHARLMAKYRQVPNFWYLVIFGA